MKVLLVLASRAKEVVSREQLLDEVWPRTYSGDAALTRCISLLRSSLRDSKDNHRFIETVSKSGYRLVAPVDELESEDRIEAAQPGRIRRVSKTVLAGWLVIAVIIVTAASYYLKSAPNVPESDSQVDPGVAGASAVSDFHTIAVMPFANMSGDSGNEYLSDGVSEEILNVLARVPNLRVTSRSSSFSFKETSLPLSEVATKLGVDSILEGSVRKFGDRIRVSVQLIEAQSDVLLWSETYDHEFENMLMVQNEIARAVTDTLQVALNIEKAAVSESKGRFTSASSEVHEAILRGRFLMAQRTQQSLEDAVVEFKNALSLEPDNPTVLSELAITYLLLSRNRYGSLSDAEALQFSQSYAAKALQRGPDSAEAHAASGFVSWRKGNSKLAEHHFLTALDINPNYAIVYHWMSMLQYRNLGKHEESFKSSKMSRLLDPLSIPSSTIHIQMLMVRGLHEEAAIELEKLKSISITSYQRMRGELGSLDGNWLVAALGQFEALLIDPSTTSARNIVPRELIHLGLIDEASAFDQVNNPLVLTLLNKPDEAVRVARLRLQSDPQSIWAKKNLARSYIYAGQADLARPLLEELWEKADKRAAVISAHFFTLAEGLALYTLRLADGDVAGAKEIEDAIHAEIQRARGAGISVTRRNGSLDFSEGAIRYLSGEKQQGLMLIKTAVSDGYWIRLNAPYLESLVSDPEFEPILAIQLATEKRERDKLLSIVCRDNPYQAVWQPSAKTCLQWEGSSQDFGEQGQGPQQT